MKEAKTKNKIKPYEHQVLNRYKNYRTMLYFGLASIGMLFLFLTITYFFNSYLNPDRPRLQISPLFYFSTIVIIASSVAMYIAKKNFYTENYPVLRKMMVISSILSGLFMLSQFAGWNHLNSSNLSIIKHTGASFLFIISGLHVLHILGGFIFMLHFTSKCISQTKDEVKALVFFSDVKHLHQIELLNMYWHFLGLVWIYIMLFFLLIR